MKKPLVLSRKGLLWTMVGIIVSSIAFAVCCSNVMLLFSGLLAAFTVLLVYVTQQLGEIQKDFNTWTQEVTERRQNPKLIFHGSAKWGLNEKGNLRFYASNPGETLISITEVQIVNAAIGNPVATGVTWRSEFPLLSTHEDKGNHEHSGFPAPVFAGGLTWLRANFTPQDIKKWTDAGLAAKCQFLVKYKVGGADEEKEEPLGISNDV